MSLSCSARAFSASLSRRACPGRIHFLFKEAAGELLGLFGKAAPFRLLAEEHLRVLGKGALCDKQPLFESRVLGLKFLHLFLFFGSRFLKRSFYM